jgi:MtrB/PioB family decaheme-associated outer membrane protein
VAVKAPPSGLADQVRTNVPHDRTLAQWNLEADYTLTTGIAIKGGLQRQEIKRTLLETNRTAENAYKLELRSNILEDVTGLIGYTNSTRRNTNYDANAWWLATYNNTLTPGAPGAYAATGAGASPPYFGANLLGVPNPAEAKFFLANRNRGQWRALLNAAPTEALTLGAGLDYNRDDYQNSVYGLTASNSWAINLDASYQVNANVTLSAYYSHENIWSSQAGNAGNAALPETVGGYTGPQYLNPLRQWDATIRDKVNTLGMSLRQKGLHGGRIELAGDLVLTQSATGYAFGGGNVYATPAPPAAIATEAVPDATSRYLSLVLDGKYALGRNSSVRLTYVYRRLVSSDYQWDSLVGVTLPSMVATNETSPHYAVSVLGVTYVHRFQ